ncbi:MAG: [LysW]-aminoadipate kinase [Candidatus Sumerlaeota bacterium]|nr:[LysW]-aminoadipate kinase [Candidatus Sumerlaeota bacterium]
MIVVKIGGSKGTDYQLICEDIATRIKAGAGIIVVHGGSHETNVLSEALGRPPRFVTSITGHESRRTDRATMEMFMMAVAGKINTLIVESLQKLGVNAVGLTGLDGRLLEGPRKDHIKVIENGKRLVIRDDFTGTVKQVNTALIQLLIGAGYTPVIAPIAISENSEAINVDGDRAAAMIGAALGAENLVIFSNVPGLLRDIANPDSLIERIPLARLDEFEKFAAGRMKKKLLGAREALESGLKSVTLCDGRVPAPLTRALEGKGTVIAA